MTEDQRRNKIHAENSFYLELQDQHGGNFEAMLTMHELAIWEQFPDFHQALFKTAPRWEFAVKNSLEPFNPPSGRQGWQLADARLQLYWQVVGRAGKVMTIDQLAMLLFPLNGITGDYFTDEVVRLISVDEIEPWAWPESVDNGSIVPDEKPNKAQKVSIYNALFRSEKHEAAIHVDSIASKALGNAYLVQCAAVWRGYLQAEQVQQPDNQGKKLIFKLKENGGSGVNQRNFKKLFEIFGNDVESAFELWEFVVLLKDDRVKTFITNIKKGENGKTKTASFEFIEDAGKKREWRWFQKEFSNQTEKVEIET